MGIFSSKEETKTKPETKTCDCTSQLTLAYNNIINKSDINKSYTKYKDLINKFDSDIFTKDFIDSYLSETSNLKDKFTKYEVLDGTIPYETLKGICQGVTFRLKKYLDPGDCPWLAVYNASTDSKTGQNTTEDPKKNPIPRDTYELLYELVNDDCNKLSNIWNDTSKSEEVRKIEGFYLYNSLAAKLLKFTNLFNDTQQEFDNIRSKFKKSIPTTSSTPSQSNGKKSKESFVGQIKLTFFIDYIIISILFIFAILYIVCIRQFSKYNDLNKIYLVDDSNL